MPWEWWENLRDYHGTGNSTTGNPAGAGMHNFSRWRSLKLVEQLRTGMSVEE